MSGIITLSEASDYLIIRTRERSLHTDLRNFGDTAGPRNKVVDILQGKKQVRLALSSLFNFFAKALAEFQTRLASKP